MNLYEDCSFMALSCKYHIYVCSVKQQISIEYFLLTAGPDYIHIFRLLKYIVTIKTINKFVPVSQTGFLIQ